MKKRKLKSKVSDKPKKKLKSDRVVLDEKEQVKIPKKKKNKNKRQQENSTSNIKPCGSKTLSQKACDVDEMYKSK
jgi:hypothetical protein